MTREKRTAPATAMLMIVVMPSWMPEVGGDWNVPVVLELHSHHCHSFYYSTHKRYASSKSIRNALPICVCGAVKIGRFLPENERLLTRIGRLVVKIVCT